MSFHIGDTHFNHTNIIQYCNRPFYNTIEMQNFIVKEWNKVIRPEDTVFHHGDFAFNLSLGEVSNLVNMLNGNIILITGNHDRKGKGWFKSAGFAEVIKNKIDMGRFVLSHRYIEELTFDQINIHGHSHHRIPFIYGEGRYINVSCEVVGYKPVWIDTGFNGI